MLNELISGKVIFLPFLQSLHLWFFSVELACDFEHRSALGEEVSLSFFFL